MKIQEALLWLHLHWEKEQIQNHLFFVKNHSQICMGHMFLGVDGPLFELPNSLATWFYLASLHLRHLTAYSILYLLICVAFLWELFYD